MPTGTRARSLPWTDDAKGARLIAADPMALMVGFLLDQQVPMEWAFGAPERLRQRLGSKLSARKIAAMDTAALVEAFVAKPPLHRYPASMARRTQKLAQVMQANLSEIGIDIDLQYEDTAASTARETRGDWVFTVSSTGRFAYRPDPAQYLGSLWHSKSTYYHTGQLIDPRPDRLSTTAADICGHRRGQNVVDIHPPDQRGKYSDFPLRHYQIEARPPSRNLDLLGVKIAALPSVFQ